MLLLDLDNKGVEAMTHVCHNKDILFWNSFKIIYNDIYNDNIQYDACPSPSNYNVSIWVVN